MRLAKTPGDFFLQISGIVPSFYQALQERLIGSLVSRITLVHKLRLRDCSAIPQNRESLMKGDGCCLAERRI